MRPKDFTLPEIVLISFATQVVILAIAVAIARYS